MARVIHDSGPRARGPFIAVNCAAIPETMLEAELFGFEPGAFTDATRAKPGLFEAASGGTLFLNEIDALPLVLQGKLLTAIETKRVRCLGAVTERGVDVKCIAASNADLPEVVAMGRFRADLYHRLAVVVLVLPPLREREADILVHRIELKSDGIRMLDLAHDLPCELSVWLVQGRLQFHRDSELHRGSPSRLRGSSWLCSGPLRGETGPAPADRLHCGGHTPLKKA
jgi:transcriptional regulator of acetoin/glycerol metabolism